MYNYVIKDLMSASRYLPHAFIISVIVVILVGAYNRRRLKKGEEPVSVIPATFFWAYGLLVLCITFLSREGNDNTGIYLELFSSFGINKRNNAYIIENILLFIPFGFAGAWFGMARSLLVSILLGAGFSFFIESLQYITGRGVFQVDDILTNAVGMLIGCLIYKVYGALFGRRK